MHIYPAADTTARSQKGEEQQPAAEENTIVIRSTNIEPTTPIGTAQSTQWLPMKVNLPQITLPTFNGNIDHYLEFKEQFQSILNHLNVDDVTKLKYLKTSVTGEAADLLRSIPIIPSNLEVAWKSLEEMYGGEIRIKHSLLLKLRQLPGLSNNKNPADLQSYTIQAAMIFEQLLNMHSDIDNLSTCELIQSKLPKRIIHKLYGQGESQCPKSTKELLQKIKEISKAERLVAEIHNKNSNGPRNATTMSTVNNQYHRRNQDHRQQINGQNQPPRQPVNIPCALCAEERMMHHPHLCRKYNSIQLRKERITELGLCYKCLQRGHIAKRCSSNCRNCQGNHHESICQRSIGQNQNSRNQSSRQGIITGQQNQHTNRQPTHTQHSSSRPTANMLNGNSTGHGNSNNNGYQGNGNNNGHGSSFGNSDSNGYQRYQRRQFQRNQNQSHYTHGTREQTHSIFADETPDDIQAVTHINNTEHDHPDNKLHLNVTPQEATLETNTDTQPLDSLEQNPLPVIMMTIDLPFLDKDGNEHIGTIFLDTGSNTSYISSSFAERLQLLPIGSKKLRINTFGSIDTRSMISNIFNVLIKTKTSTKSINLCEVPHIASNIIAVDADKITCDKLLQGDEIQLNRQHKDIDVLIGLDHYLLLLGQVKTLRLSSGLQLHITDCGHILSGKEHPQQDVITFSNIVNNQNAKDDLCEQLQKFWSLESIGIKDVNPQSKAEEETNQFFHQTTTRQADGRYVVRLPYADQRNIPSNRALAYGRLQSALRQLEKNPEMLKKYAAIFTEQLSLEFIEEVPDESISDGPVVSYLPHHPVIKETSKSTKVRIVFDGSAKTNKVNHSLNDHLHTGERLLPDIAAILLRIRQHNILISGDIEKAFLQLVLHQTDRDATRFLWKDPTDGRLICYRYRRVPFGLKPSPYLLNKTVRTHLESIDHPWAQAMINSFYVDNVFMGLDTAEEAMDFYIFAKKVFAEAQMNLCQFCSNSSTVNTFFAKHEKDTTIDRNQKILGISWDTETDEMIFMLPVPKTELLTKRTILKIIASCYDPLEFLTPVTLYGKLFFQQLATKDQSWDLPLSLNQHDSWKNVCTKWTGSEWRLKRRLFPDDFNIKTDQLELHIFTDASQLAYGSVAYLRITQSNGKADSNYLLSKSRVAPVKSKYSIPQLETLGILTGVRLGNYCFQHIGLKIHQVYVWSDSLCSIDSLHTKSTSGSRFVKNRVREINELGERFIFSHVAGKINPADFLTRGLSFEELKQSELWLKGPSFLQSSDPLPLRLNSNSTAPTAVTSALSISHPPAINVTRFSSFHRLLHMVMILIHFITRGKCSTQEKIARSKRLIFRLAQRTDPPSPETIQALQLHKDQDNDLWMFDGRERMISLIKRALLRAGSSTTLFELDDFRTLLAECVSTINMRPLTYQTTDENIEPLTPTDFVFPQRRPSNDLLILNTPQDFDDLPLSKRSLADEWQRLSSMTETFQRKWHQDYISVLQARRDFSHPQGKTSSYQPKIGDIVLINQPSSKSTTWPLARILEVKERSAIVKNGKTKRIVEYPFKLLFPLERPHTPDVQQQSTDDSSTTPTADANDSVPKPTSTESTTTDNQGPQLRRSTRLRMPTQFFSAITILALITGSSGFEICQCTTTPIPTTTDSSPTTFGYLHQWITIVLLLLMFFGIYGWINFFLILQCLFTWIEKCIQCVFSIVRLGSKQCRQHRQISPTIIVLLCLIQRSYSCNEIASIQGTDDVCTASADGKTCHLNKVVSINIRPNSQVGCFTISNNVKEVKNIEVRANSIISECNERSHHFTRQMKINHFFSHRCAGMGSCKGSTCENLNAEDGVPEFPAIAMDGPGFSRCYRSCGCVTCDCGSCSPSCLFSRISAEPTSFSIYEIFQCPTWNTRLEISVTINNNTTVYEVDHGIPLQLEDNMTLIVTGFSIPPSPIHGALFLRRMNLDGPSDISYSLSQPAQAGRPLRGTLSEVQCATAKDATDFNCLFDENVCTCITQGVALKCDCEVLDLEEIMKRNMINNTAIEGSIILKRQGNKVTTHLKSSSILSVQLHLANYTVHRLVKEDKCEVTKTTLSGCHSCSSGGQLTVTCKSSHFPQIVSTIECSTFTSFANCSTDGKMSTISILTNHVNVVENCTSSCGPEKLHFVINGSLSTIPTFDNKLSKGLFHMQELITSDTIWTNISEFVSSAWEKIYGYLISLINNWISSWLCLFIIILLLLCCSRRRCRSRFHGEYRRRYRRFQYRRFHESIA